MPDKSNAQIAAENARVVAEYLTKHGVGQQMDDRFEIHTDLSGHTLPMHNGRLNKSAIADELQMGRSVWTQNPLCRSLIQAVEAALGAAPPAARSGTDPRIRELERRVQQLECRNAVLAAENAELRSKVRKLDWIDGTLPETGRLPW